MKIRGSSAVRHGSTPQTPFLADMEQESHSCLKAKNIKEPYDLWWLSLVFPDVFQGFSPARSVSPALPDESWRMASILFFFFFQFLIFQMILGFEHLECETSIVDLMRASRRASVVCSTRGFRRWICRSWRPKWSENARCAGTSFPYE